MEKSENNNESEINIKELLKQTIASFSVLYILMGLCFFIPAWDIFYWEAWLFIVTWLVMMLYFLRYLLKNDPELLQRRLQKGEKREAQKLVITISNFIFFAIWLIPGFDHRFNWSFVPPILVLIADAIFAIGYIFFFQVLKENSFAARTVEVEKGVQKVITTGPYAIVRHPMYTAVLIMFGMTPLCLGSYWALIPYSLTIPLLVYRIRDEEKLLCEELEGYKEYMEKTKYRILPGIW